MNSLSAMLDVVNTLDDAGKKVPFHVVFGTSEGKIIEYSSAISIGHTANLKENGAINIRATNNSSRPTMVDTWLIESINGKTITL